MIPWHDLLLLLKGQPVHLPAPKTHYEKDILLSTDTPIFVTSSGQICHVKHGVVDETETEMMAVRCRAFKFTVQIPSSIKGI